MNPAVPLNSARLARLARCLVMILAPWAPAADAPLGDASKLPPPAGTTVDFQRDIRPILESACLRCHGREKPKSDYRLDSREAAIKGGDLGTAIVPGNSAASPFIHYVARLVEDLEMPPTGKGEPLTLQQVALLRAWVDQGVPWEGDLGAPEPPRWSLSLPVRWISLDGDAARFREHHWQRPDWGGGLEELTYHHREGERSVNITARALGGADDFGISFELRQTDLGFIRGGAEQFRRWTDDSGGFYPAFSTPLFALDRELFLDTGRAWIDLGLTLPDWPQVVVGYEYQWRDGEKSLLQWGQVTETGVAGGVPRNIFPTVKDIDERVHLVKLDVDHTLGGWRLGDSFRGEFYELNTSRDLITRYDFASPTTPAVVTIREGHSSFTGANAFRLERQLRDWLFASGGYLYSRHDGDGTFSLLGQRSPGFPEAWRSTQIVLEREAHVFNLNTLLSPWRHLTLALGAQAEWARQEGLTVFTQDTAPPLPPLPEPFVVTVDSDLDTLRVQESALLRFTAIPYTTLFAEARLDQERVDQFEHERLQFDSLSPPDSTLLRDTDAGTDGYDWRGGISTSPWSRASFSAHYRQVRRTSDYDHLLDEEFGGPGQGYSAFLRERETLTDEVEARLSLRPASWLRAVLTARWQWTDYWTLTDNFPSTGGGAGAVAAGVPTAAGQFDADIYGLHLVFTGLRNVYLSTSFTWQDIESSSFINGSAAVVPYSGDIYSVSATARYVLNPRTELFGTYAFSCADFSQANFAAGLPLGIEYTQHTAQVGISRRLRDQLRARLGYGVFLYDEPSSGGLNDYTAHMVFGALSLLVR
jgi:hypothetical protein